MVKTALFVRLEAKPGKEEDVANFLRNGLALVQEEPATTAWFAIRFAPTTFGIFDAFPDEAGRQAHNAEGDEQPNITMNNLVDSVRATGALGVVGVFVPEDPKGPDKLEKKGQLAFDMGKFFHKGLRMGSGQCNVKAYNRYLRDLIAADRAKPSFIVSHSLPLNNAPDAYKHFDARDKGWTKVVLKPAATAAAATTKH